MPQTTTETHTAMTPAAAPAPTAVHKITANLLVEAIEPCIPFWTERLGFDLTVQVPDGDRLGFAILAKDNVEVMYQTWASIRTDIPALADGADSRAPARTALYIEVADVDAAERAMRRGPDAPDVIVPRRKTFYGADEFGVREPGGHVVIFAQHG